MCETILAHSKHDKVDILVSFHQLHMGGEKNHVVFIIEQAFNLHEMLQMHIGPDV